MLANLFRRGDYGTPAGGLNNPSVPLLQGLAGLELGGYGPSSAGASVTTTSAMRVVAALACVKLIAQTIASLPLVVYRREERGRTELRLPADRYLWGRPNPEMTRQSFWEAAIGSAVLTGNSYTYVVRDGLGRIAELWPLNPRRVEQRRDDDGYKSFIVEGRRYYGLHRPAGAQSEILHVPGYGDGWQGLSPIGQAREAFGLAIAAEEFGGRFFGQGSTMSGILTTDGKLDDETSLKLEQRWNKARAGTRNAFKTAILEGGLKWQQVGVNPEDGQFLETRKFQVEEIARLFGVPPHMIGAVDKTTSWGSGIEQQTIGFVIFTLRSWMTRFEQAGSDELLAADNRFMAWNANGLMRGDSRTRAAWYQAMRNLRVMTPNQIAEREDLPTYEGGDDYAAPFNSATSGKATDDEEPPARREGGDDE